MMVRQNNTEPLTIGTPPLRIRLLISEFSSERVADSSEHVDKVRWSTHEYICVHKKVRESGLYNFQGCKIPIPTAIWYDRIEASLGPNISPKDQLVVSLLKYGMPINCNPTLRAKSICKLIIL